MTQAPAGPPAHCALQSATKPFSDSSSARSSLSFLRTAARWVCATARAAAQSRAGAFTSATSSRTCSIGKSKSRQRLTKVKSLQVCVAIDTMAARAPRGLGQQADVLVIADGRHRALRLGGKRSNCQIIASTHVFLLEPQVTRGVSHDA